MSIKVKKEFEIVSDFIDEMMRDVNGVNTDKISLILKSGVIMDVSDNITLYNGFLKVDGDDNKSLLKYRDISGYTLHISPCADMDELWYYISSSSHISIPLPFLKRRIPHDIKSHIILSFMGDNNGYSMEEMREEINKDRWFKDRYDSYMKCDTYEELNNSMRDYIWELSYPSHVLEELYDDDIYDVDDIKSLSSHNNEIRYHIPPHSKEMEILNQMMGDDVDE